MLVDGSPHFSRQGNNTLEKDSKLLHPTSVSSTKCLELARSNTRCGPNVTAVRRPLIALELNVVV